MLPELSVVWPTGTAVVTELVPVPVADNTGAVVPAPPLPV